jgi:hypothetical protein
MKTYHQLEKLTLFCIAAWAAMGSMRSAEIKMGDGAVMNIGLRLQGWAQWTEDGAADGSDKTDFSARRVYLYVGGRSFLP